MVVIAGSAVTTFLFCNWTLFLAPLLTLLVIFGTIERFSTGLVFGDWHIGDIMRKFFSYGLLSITIFWLVANYLPESVLVLPKASLEKIIPTTVQQGIFIALMALFVVIQVSLVFSTNRLFKSDQSSMPPLSQNLEKFGLKRGPELFWTSVPVAMTLVTLLLTFTIFS